MRPKCGGGEVGFQKGKRQLASYLKSERANEGYYVVFDHRTKPVHITETSAVEGFDIRSYVIPVIQQKYT